MTHKGLDTKFQVGQLYWLPQDTSWVEMGLSDTGSYKIRHANPAVLLSIKPASFGFSDWQLAFLAADSNGVSREIVYTNEGYYCKFCEMVVT